jgi:hypothetical protein
MGGIMDTYKKVNAEELTKMIIAAPFGSEFSFGSPHLGDYSQEYLDDDSLEYWDGCYTEKGRLDNDIFIIDHYGGGQAMCETLDCFRDRFSAEDEQYILSALKDYFKTWVGAEYVYAKQEIRNNASAL